MRLFEVITRPAFYDVDKEKIYIMDTFHDAELAIEQEFGIEDISEYDEEQQEELYDWVAELEQGFVTDKGEFLDRREAADYVGQVKDLDTNDLYPKYKKNSSKVLHLVPRE